jgi:CBS domain-containing protein
MDARRITAGSLETERIMAGSSAEKPSSPTPHTPAIAADVMRPALTTVETNAHLAAAAYLMKHAGETALVVIDEQARRPIGLVTDADIAQAVADQLDVNQVRIQDLMVTNPTYVNATATIREAAEVMITGRIRHLPVVSNAGLVGIVDIGDVCRALLGPRGG